MEPKYWNSVFSLRVIKAYEKEEISHDERSIRKWYDGYNKPNGTSTSDVQEIRCILEYYDAGHQLECREALEKCILREGIRNEEIN